MERFLVIYRGASLGASDVAQYHPDAWSGWFERLGDALVDRGALTRDSVEIPTRLIGPKQSSSSLSGYSVVAAADFDAIVRLVQDCPIFDERGSVEIARLV